MLENPCYNSETHSQCSRRHSGCSADCPEWDKYVEARDAEYKKRRMDGLALRPFWTMDDRIKRERSRRHARRVYKKLRKL